MVYNTSQNKQCNNGVLTFKAGKKVSIGRLVCFNKKKFVSDTSSSEQTLTGDNLWFPLHDFCIGFLKCAEVITTYIMHSPIDSSAEQGLILELFTTQVACN